MRLGGRGGLRRCLLGGLRLLGLHMGFVVANRAAGGCTQNGMVASHVAGHATDSGAGHATSRIGRNRRSQKRRHSKNSN